MKQNRHKFTVILLASLATLIFAFQNCAEVDLELGQQQAELQSHNANGIEGFLPEPNTIDPSVRIVFFVDQSTSMLRERCIQELDWRDTVPEEQKTGNTQTCAFTPGIDPDAERYQLIQKWIDSFAPYKDEVDVKFAILPFSGGIRQRPRAELGDDQKMLFLPANEASVYRQQLVDEQSSDKNAMMADMASNPLYMGTTIPLPVMSYAKNLIKLEMDNLNELGQLGNTKFHFVYLSDGIFKPKPKLFDRAKEVLGCADCSKSANRNHPSCSPYPPSGYKCEYKIGDKRVIGCLYHICNQYLYDVMVENWGDPTKNDFNLIKDSLAEIKNFENFYFEASINLYFVSLFPDRQQRYNWEPGDPYWSLFDKIKEEFPEEEYIEYQGGLDLPFTFGLPKQQEVHFEVENFYAINLNVSVDSFNRLQKDSDSDGIDDRQEASLGYNPNIQRSNNVCLDIITEKFGCDPALAVSCSPTFDFDGDGLNQCEEQILNTKERDADSDNDGVLDGHEILRGLNPNKDDREDFLAADSFSAMDHFIRGVHPIISVNSVADSFKIDLRINKEGYSSHTSSNGSVYYSPNFLIDIRSLPASEVSEYTNYFYPSRNWVVQDQYIQDEYVLGTGHKLNENEYLFVLKMRQAQHPSESYWFYKRVYLGVDKAESISLKLSEFEPLNLEESRED